jgi:hypothetical protein
LDTREKLDLIFVPEQSYSETKGKGMPSLQECLVSDSYDEIMYDCTTEQVIAVKRSTDDAIAKTQRNKELLKTMGLFGLLLLLLTFNMIQI